MKISEQYIKQVWQKYPKEKRLELEKLLDRKGDTAKEINKFETKNLVDLWKKVAKKVS